MNETPANLSPSGAHDNLSSRRAMCWRSRTPRFRYSEIEAEAGAVVGRNK
jgi:hypothetical protein